jgi:anti-sigma B factor antagonist
MINNFEMNILPAQENPDIMIVSLIGSLDSITSAELEKTLLTLINKRINKIIINLADLNYISSAGWGIFIGIIKQVRASKGDLKLSGITKEILDIADLLGIKDIIPTYRTDHEAVSSFV